MKFILNWHHHLICDAIDDVFAGRKKNIAITVSPGSSKTEIVVINTIARGLAINPRARFLHLSGSDSLASLNSATARDIVRSSEFQELWPMKISDDADSKKRWNVVSGGKMAGGVYATALAGQVTGFRAGHMAEGFQGCVLLDDLSKPEDAFSRTKLEAANRRLITTVKSRRANPDTPIILVMQRIAERDPVGLIESGNLEGDWTVIRIPAVMDEETRSKLAPKYQALIQPSERIDGRFSYWPYKEPIQQLLLMEKGQGADSSGSRISRHVFNSQYQQTPTALGGNIVKGEWFPRYRVLPQIKWRKIFADTAQKTKEVNDYSVFIECGLGIDGKAYLLDLIRGKWEAPELQRRAIAFWNKAKARETNIYGHLRKMVVEDKSSGTGLIQTIKLHPYNIPIEPIERDRDKVSRLNDALPYIECGLFCIPEESPYTNDFVAECEAFSADNSHDHDDQIDPTIDAIMDLLSSGNKLKVWEQVGLDNSIIPK